MTKLEINNIKSWEVLPEDATPNMLLFYRLGDFYETFFEDAYVIARELEVTLTSRDYGALGKIPLAGIPVKSVEAYVEKLVQKNIKVAICEQLEDPKYTKLW